jgi:hypothetical protein
MKELMKGIVGCGERAREGVEELVRRREREL